MTTPRALAEAIVSQLDAYYELRSRLHTSGPPENIVERVLAAHEAEQAARLDASERSYQKALTLAEARVAQLEAQLAEAQHDRAYWKLRAHGRPHDAALREAR